MQKIKISIVIKKSVCFLYIIHKRFDTFWRPSHYFLYIYDRWITFFMKASQVPSYSNLHQPPAKIFHVLLKVACTHSSWICNNSLSITRISFSDQNISKIFSYYQLIFCMRSKVIVIATTLRAGRSGYRVLVRERVSFHLQNINAAFEVHETSLTMGAGVLPEVVKSGCC